VVVNFWNSWCIPCQTELPALKKFYAAHADDSDFVMVGIVRRDDTKTVKEFVTGEGIDWKIALDPSKQAALDFGTRGQPETFAISPSGQIVAYKPGPMSLPELEAFLSHARQAG
jgi:cytochrome c biogenesis protein CcmG/thiol:disulfide interchange protein DsbE